MPLTTVERGVIRIHLSWGLLPSLSKKWKLSIFTILALLEIS